MVLRIYKPMYHQSAVFVRIGNFIVFSLLWSFLSSRTRDEFWSASGRR